jgi:D-beta-D-heptose 7-phosphate kinase/D-beta-D-heptose 1-phosphate adenosyltransferase
MLTERRVREVLNPNLQVLVVGEMMLDEFIWGKVSRISPEAPVPVVEVVRETFNTGGAANVAHNLRGIIDGVHMLGITGAGQDADILRSLLVAQGVRLDAVQFDADYITIRKTRVVARSQQVVRVDRERRRGFTAAQKERAYRDFQTLLPTIHAVILTDYDKGLHEQDFVDTIVRLARSAGRIVCVDPKPSNPVKWHDITCVTPNRTEAFKCAGRSWSDPADDPLADAALLDVGARLLDLWKCEHLLVTLSEQGMILFDPDQPPLHIPTRAQEVTDVSGAGDTAIALFTAALAGGASAPEAAEIANHASGIVVGKIGTATISREELFASFLD